mgnify:CR=1 FL=1
MKLIAINVNQLQPIYHPTPPLQSRISFVSQLNALQFGQHPVPLLVVIAKVLFEIRLADAIFFVLRDRAGALVTGDLNDNAFVFLGDGACLLLAFESGRNGLAVHFNRLRHLPLVIGKLHRDSIGLA